MPPTNYVVSAPIALPNQRPETLDKMIQTAKSVDGVILVNKDTYVKIKEAAAVPAPMIYSSIVNAIPGPMVVIDEDVPEDHYCLSMRIEKYDG